MFGDRVIILQAKSKKLTLEARKGNDRLLRSDFKASVQDAVDQAYSCAQLLGDASITLQTKDGTRVELAQRPKTIFPITVVANHYPALVFQVRQFLKFQTDEHIISPLVIDVFALDVITERLDSRLRLLSYLTLRARFGEKLISGHELPLLAYHLTQNLWLSEDIGLMSVEDNFTAPLDAAMAVRRDGLPGARTPDGILARMYGTPFSRIVVQLEANTESSAIGLGLFLLELGEDTIIDINRFVKRAMRRTARDGQLRNMNFAVLSAADGSTGVTIHCSPLISKEAEAWLRRRCDSLRSSHAASRWFGLAVSPDGSIQATLELVGPVPTDAPVMIVPQSTILPASDSPPTMTKIGRNQRCPCGNGKKYKRCPDYVRISSSGCRTALAGVQAAA